MGSLTRGGVAALVAAVALLGANAKPTATPSPPATTTLVGTFALQGAAAKVAATMMVTKGPDGTASLDIVQTNQGAPILQYDTDMTQLMHLVVVRDDFAEFQHLHPVFDATTGHFAQTVSLAQDHRYYVFTDSEPQGIGQQVFRFGLAPRISVKNMVSIPHYPASSPTVTEGAYTVTISQTKLRANRPATIDVSIAKGSVPADDLQPYLGAAAHAIFIATTTLQYTHVHPTVAGAKPMDMHGMEGMDMGPEPTGPNLVMQVPALPPDSYKLWLQFQGGTTLYTAPFTLVVQ